SSSAEGAATPASTATATALGRIGRFAASGSGRGSSDRWRSHVHVVCPGSDQLRYIRGVDLLEARIAGAAQIVPKGRPIVLGVSHAGHTNGGQREAKDLHKV